MAKHKFLLYIAGLLTYLPFSKRLSLLVDRLIILSENNNIHRKP